MKCRLPTKVIQLANFTIDANAAGKHQISAKACYIDTAAETDVLASSFPSQM